jgi:hypothetical protein
MLVGRWASPFLPADLGASLGLGGMWCRCCLDSNGRGGGLFEVVQKRFVKLTQEYLQELLI